MPFAGLMVCNLTLQRNNYFHHLMGLCLLMFVLFSISQVVFYEALKDLADQGKQKFPQYGVNSSVEGLVLGGLSGGTLG